MAANLTFIAIQARKGIRYGILFLVFLMVARVLFGIGRNIYNAVAPRPTAAPTAGFKVLPPINYPDPNIEYPELTYTVETATGELPELDSQMNVYFIPPKTADLFAFDTMTKLANSFSFTQAPRQLSETTYLFNHTTSPATLRADIVYKTFSISYNLAIDSSPLLSRPPTQEVATSRAKDALSRAEILPEDLTGPVVQEYLKVEGQNLVKALSLSDAQLVQVNLYRKNFGTEEKPYPSVTSNKNQSNVWFIISGANERERQIIAAEYKYFAIDEESVETYPVKTAQQALEDLINGEGYIANLGLNIDGKITIRDIYLAYYDPERPSDFYQPVVVFEGDGDFVAYVPAVTDEYYGQPQTEQEEENPNQ